MPYRTVDLVPTIADVLGVRLPWKVDGRSLLATDLEAAPVVVMKRDGTWVEASSSEVQRDVDVTITRKSALFGEGEDWLFDIGSNRQLLGLAIAGMSKYESNRSRVHFDDEEVLTHVRLSSSFVPARVTGFIGGIEIPSDVELAVAVNGRIAALTRCFSRDGQQRFSVLVPETVFREGFNQVELLSIEGTPSAPRLLELGETEAPTAESLDLVPG